MFKKLTQPPNCSQMQLGDKFLKNEVFSSDYPSTEQYNYLDFFKDYLKQHFNAVNHNLSPVFNKKAFDCRPYVVIELFDIKITALFDTGATVSIVGNTGVEILKNLNLDFYPTKTKFVCVADGSQQKVIGVVDLPIVINDVCRVISALVVPSVEHDFIFGSDFANKFSLLVDFKNNTWFSQSSPNSSFNFKNNVCILNTTDTLSKFQKDKAQKVIDSFREISSKDRLGRTDKISLTIDTGDSKPFKQKQYLMSPYMLKILNSELDEMLKLGVVEPSNSPYCSPVLLVKKANGEHRFVLDSRILNQNTRQDSYPLPNIDRIINMLRGAKFISKIDLRKSFWQLPLDESSREKTAFSITGRGLFHFTVVPFGLCNAAQVQQRLVDAIFGPKYEPCIFTYLDDIIILSKTFDEHINLLTEVKNKLQEANLTISMDKCEFFKTTLKFLGFVVGANGLRTDPEKVSAMVNYPCPTNTTEIKRFVGMCSWYRRFIKDFSTLLAPINSLLHGKKRKSALFGLPKPIVLL